MRKLLGRDVHYKCKIEQSRTLKYFNPSQEIYVETEASEKGLGCVLMQPGESGDESKMFPVHFASRSLSTAKAGYSNIECETLGMVIAIKHLHQYMYGEQFTVITDHKPLVSLAQKPIHKLPAQLQRLFLAIQGYNYNIVYKPGKQMFISACLSRLISTERKAEKPLVRDSHVLLCEVASFKARSCHEFQQ